VGRVRLGSYDRSKIEAPRRFALLSAFLLGAFYVESSSGLFNFNSMRPSHPGLCGTRRRFVESRLVLYAGRCKRSCEYAVNEGITGE
jgi:hypothetical protein